MPITKFVSSAARHNRSRAAMGLHSHRLRLIARKFSTGNFPRIFVDITKQLGYYMLVMKINEQIRGYFAAIGRRGGKASSEAKTLAARENAKKGGWPKGRPRKPRQ